MKMFIFNKVKGNIPRGVAIDEKKQHDFCCNFYKYGTHFLFGDLRAGDSKDEPFFLLKKTCE